MKGINLLLLVLFLSLGSCSFFGEKNTVSDYIQKPDYSLKSVEFVPVLPNFGAGINPVSLYAGYDELLYAVDSGQAILNYDAAGNQLGRFALPGIHFVIQNRSLDLYALGQADTMINNLTYNLPVVYKISMKVDPDEDGTGRLLNLNQARVLKKMWYPFCINESQKFLYATELQQVRLTALGFLDDNGYYITSNGPREAASEVYLTRRNAILTFSASDIFQGGYTEGDGANSISPIGLTTLVQPPQRSRMEARKDFIYTSVDDNLAISVRYIEQLIDPNGGPISVFKPLATPTKKDADGYLYQPNRIKSARAVLYAGVNQKYIFVAAGDSILAFQENGYEGAIPPPQYTNKKLIRVSFGGKGSGPYQFNRPSALAYFNRTLFVADAGNRRISRYKLTSDYDQ